MDVDSCVSPLESALPAQLPGHADGTDRRAVSGSGRPACPTAIPIARSCIELSSLYWEVKDGCGQLCQPTRVGTPAQLPGHADGSQSQRSFRAEQPSRRVCTTIA
jgi:hypothetical protein